MHHSRYYFSSGQRMAMHFLLLKIMIVLAMLYLLLGFGTLHVSFLFDEMVTAQMESTLATKLFAKAGYLITLIWIWRAPFACAAVIRLFARGNLYIGRRVPLTGE